ncbi:hypothetical protein N8H74_22360 [Pseudomonas sp. B2M1-30]|uniref:hypothetical protein n=1 Tax=Pseudomonas TaxID=286 RepID=UPI0021C9A9FC|nr:MULTISPECIES: hypothetical protein [Pseudomonas]MCU0121016.1 hypothetical protein [Pseudomonas sp. B2M1-30]MCU7262645.1 hypothetical protein [Pseudomonas koreensis]
MSLLSKKAVVLLLAAVAGFGAINAQAAKAKEKAVAASVSMLGGKFIFTLPKGFIGDPIPPGPTGANGNMYTNQTTKTVVIAAENDLPGQPNLKDNDSAFLDDTVDSFVKEQRKGLSDFNKLSEKSLTLKKSGLGVRQVDSTVTQGGGLTLTTTLMAGSGNRMAIVQIISRPTDTKGHDELVNRIVSGQ